MAARFSKDVVNSVDWDTVNDFTKGAIERASTLLIKSEKMEERAERAEKDPQHVRAETVEKEIDKVEESKPEEKFEKVKRSHTD